MKVSTRGFQYTAIDDYTRLRVLGLYPGRTASTAVHFLEQRMVEEFPFPIQRIQTDRGANFWGWCSKRPCNGIALSSVPTDHELPHLNGRVERSQQTDWVEFYSTSKTSR
jgi:hypothetical protein